MLVASASQRALFRHVDVIAPDGSHGPVVGALTSRPVQLRAERPANSFGACQDPGSFPEVGYLNDFRCGTAKRSMWEGRGQSMPGPALGRYRKC